MALLSDLANAALAKTLPAFDGWLRARLGEEARIDSAKMDGKRVVVEGVRLPLGPRIQLHFRRATIAVVPRTLKSPRLYVAEAEGSITIRGADRELRADLTLSDGRDQGDAWLAGPVRVRGNDLQGELRAELTMTRWELRGELGDEVSTYRVEASGPLGGGGSPVSDLHIDFSRGQIAQITKHAAAWLDKAPPPIAIAEGARGEGELTWRAGRLTTMTTWHDLEVLEHRLPDPLTIETELRFHATQPLVEGSAKLTSARSSLRLEPLTWRRDRFEHTSVLGELALGDALLAGLFSGMWRPTSRGVARLSLALEGAADWTLSGEVTTDAVELELTERAGAPVFVFERGEATIELTAKRLRVPRWVLEGYGTQLRGEADNVFSGPPERPLLVVSFVDANVELVRALASITEEVRFEVGTEAMRPVGQRWLAPELQLSGRVSIAADLETHGELAVQTAQSALMVPLTIAAGTTHLDGTQIRGRLTTADALGLGFLDGPISLRPKGIWNINADVSGPLTSPRLRARVESDACEVNLWGVMDMSLAEVQAQVHADREAVIWKDAQAKAYRGTLKSDGVLGFTETFTGMDGNLSCDDVAIGELQLPAGPVGDHVTGLLDAQAHFRKLQSGAISGDGRVALTEPAYPVLAHARRQLDDVSLPMPPAAGTKPLHADLRFTEDAVQLSDVEAEIEGISLRAEGSIGYDGTLDGEAAARLRGAYLKKSPLFVVPATLAGGITVPIHVAGTLAQPQLTADVRRAILDKLHTRELSDAMTSAFDGLRDAADGAATAVEDLFSSIGANKKKSAAARPPDDAELEALVDRCIEGGAGTDELIDRLIEAGVTSDDILWILEKRRMRF